MGILGAMPGAIAQGLIWGIMAIGVYITYRILDFADLTVDGSLCTGGAVCVMLVINGWSIPAAIALAVVAGMAAGFITGIFHTFMGIPAILAGILTQLSLYSVNLLIMGKANQAYPYKFGEVRFMSMEAISNPWYSNTLLIAFIFVVVIIAILYWFFGTERGCSIRATGCNINMSRAQGINTEVNKVISLMLSNGLVALSGALLVFYQGNADVNMGRGAIVIGLAAVIIGEGLFSRFSSNFAYSLFTVVLGAIIYWIVYQIVTFLGMDADLLKMLSAIIVAMFLAIPYWREKYMPKKIKVASEGK